MISLCYYITYLISKKVKSNRNSEELSAVFPHYLSLLSLAATVLILLVFEERHKVKIREQFSYDGKMMQIFFSTKLGMWSPR